MKKILKKLSISVLCVALAATFLAVGVLAADSSSSQGERGKGGSGMQGGPDGKGRQGNKDDGDMILTQIQQKIAALEDEDTKTQLTKLMEAYQAALTAENEAIKSESSTAQESLDILKKATEEARNALAAALTEAGIDIMNQRGDSAKNDDRQKSDGNNAGRNGLAIQKLDTDTIETLIADLDNNTAKSDLTKLLEVYKDALAAEESGVSNTALTNDEKKALREAVTTAADALTDALSEAGIEQSSYSHRPNKTNGNAPQSDSEQSGTASSSASGSENANSTAKTGILQGVLNWLGSWLK